MNRGTGTPAVMHAHGYQLLYFFSALRGCGILGESQERGAGARCSGVLAACRTDSWASLSWRDAICALWIWHRAQSESSFCTRYTQASTEKLLAVGRTWGI